jgi:uncharacterized protein YneF (UPF0154 family)
LIHWINNKVEKLGWLFFLLAIFGIPPDVEWWKSHKDVLMTNYIQFALILILSFLITIGLIAGIFWIWYKIEKQLKSNKIKKNELKNRYQLQIEAMKKEQEDFISSVKETLHGWDIHFQKVYPNKNLTDEEKKSCLLAKTEDEIRKIYISMHVELKRLTSGAQKLYGYKGPIFEENKFDEINRKFYSGNEDLTSNKQFEALETANRIIVFEKELKKIINLVFPNDFNKFEDNNQLDIRKSEYVFEVKEVLKTDIPVSLQNIKLKPDKNILLDTIKMYTGSNKKQKNDLSDKNFKNLKILFRIWINTDDKTSNQDEIDARYKLIEYLYRLNIHEITFSEYVKQLLAEIKKYAELIDRRGPPNMDSSYQDGSDLFEFNKNKEKLRQHIRNILETYDSI